MKYKYIALNQSQQTLSGVIEAANDQAAREQLNKLGLSILNLQEYSGSSNTSADFSRYQFSAFDTAQRKIEGTIAAKNKLNALDRLVNEYQLNVIQLYSTGATEEEKLASNHEVQKLYAELNSIKKQQVINQANTEQQTKEKYKQQITSEVEKIINAIENFLKKYQTDLKPQELEYLQGRLAHLQKIKFSENLENLELSSKKILEYLQEKELFIEESQNIKAKTDVQIETRKLLTELKGIGKQNPEKQIGNIALKSKQSLWQQLTAILFDKAPAIQYPPEYTKIDQELSQVKQEIWAYFKLFFTAKQKNYRNQSQKILSQLFRKWWRLNQQLRDFKNHLSGVTSVATSIAHENIKNISAILLATYLGFYFITQLLIIKSSSINLPTFFYIYQSNILIYILLATFLLHISIRIKDAFLEHKLPYPNISYGIGIFVFVVLILNF